MTALGYYEQLDFNAPLSAARADALAGALAATAPATVLDLGCGWAELLLRVLARAPGARGRGLDTDDALLERGRANAAARGVDARVDLVAAESTSERGRADVVICIGADHAFGDQGAALRALHGRVTPGGRLLFGTGFAERPPTPEIIDLLGELSPLADLIDLAVSHGFRPLDIQVANTDEWCAFESGYLADWELWLLRNAAHPDAAATAAKADQHRSEWLRGYRGVLGFAYLTLGVPAR